jgi:hypothetical protein
MSKLVCKSYFDATEAEDDVDTLIAVGHYRSDITVVVSDRGRRRYREESAPRGLRRGSVIADAVLGESRSRAVRAIVVGLTPRQLDMPIIEEDEAVMPLIVCGSLTNCFKSAEHVAGTGDDLLDVMLGAGVARRIAERLLLDVFRGGILVAIRVNDAASAIAQRILGEGNAQNSGLGSAR